MRRARTILILGFVAGLTGYAGIFFFSTSAQRSLQSSNAPELAWLKHEFQLSDAEFERINRLHEAYLPECMRMCARVEAKNAQLRQLLSNTNTVTPAIEQVLGEAAQIRIECQKMMLEHFYAVSRSMPPEQGKRYLAWMQEKTMMPTYHQAAPADAEQPSQAHHHH